MEELQAFLDEKGIGVLGRGQQSRLARFAHFWLMVTKSFSRNRCPVRAAALVYTALFAMIPMIAVVISISTGILKTRGEADVSRLIDKLVNSFIPNAVVEGTNSSDVVVHMEHRWPWKHNAHNETVGVLPNDATGTNEIADIMGTTSGPDRETDLHTQVTRKIHEFVQNTNSSAWGMTGTLFLILTVVFMLANIENTFNDIWGVSRGRNWFVRVEKYVFAIVGGAILMALVGGLMNGSRLEPPVR